MMAAPGGEGVIDRLTFAQTTLQQHQSIIQKLLEQHFTGIRSLLEGAKQAADQTLTGTAGACTLPSCIPEFNVSAGQIPSAVCIQAVPGPVEVNVPAPLIPTPVIPESASFMSCVSVRDPMMTSLSDKSTLCPPHLNGSNRPTQQSIGQSKELTPTLSNGFIGGRLSVPAHRVERRRRQTAIYDIMAVLKGKGKASVSPAAKHSQMSTQSYGSKPSLKEKASWLTAKLKPGRTSGAEDSSKQRGVFCYDREGIKESIRQTISFPQRASGHMYKQHGIAQWISKSTWFENITLCVNAINVLWLAIDTDLNDEDVWFKAQPLFAVMENLFCCFFLAELLIRFSAFRVKTECFRDTWFTFDSLLVFLMVAETWVLAVVSHFVGISTSATNVDILRTIRLLKLTRVSRSARLLRATPEFMVLVKGMAAGFRSVCTTLSLMSFLIYLFAITFRLICKDSALESLGFKSVPETMLTLLNKGVLEPDLKVFTFQLAGVEIFYAILFYLFILLASITVMNMLIGMMVEVVAVVSEVEREHIEVDYVRKQCLGLLGESEAIAKEDFETLLTTPEAVKALMRIDVDVLGLVDYIDYFFWDDAPITFDKLMGLLLDLRGTNKAKVKDIVELRKVVMEEFNGLQESIIRLEAQRQLAQPVEIS